jgi:hypothetical protein
VSLSRLGHLHRVGHPWGWCRSGYRRGMTITPEEPLPETEVVPSSDPTPIPTPDPPPGPGEDPGAAPDQPEIEPPADPRP